MNLNRVTSFALAAVLLMLVSCGQKEQAPPPASQSTPAPASSAEGSGQRPAPADAVTAEPAPAAGAPDAGAAGTAAPAGKEATAATPPPATRPAQPAPAKTPLKDPNVFTVRFETTKGNIDIECHKDWAPLGTARFRELVESGYFEGARFFRVVPGFVVQFGIAANPLITAKWEGTEIQDDPVQQSNTRGMVSFATAGRNTRTTQLFINLGDNPRLDNMGFSPIGRVVRGMGAVDMIDSRYGEQPQQPRIEDEGEQYLSSQFPYLDKIVSARVID
jgi:cyclophilin family peptidyl-prolyl cis-trans isomerase